MRPFMARSIGLSGARSSRPRIMLRPAVGDHRRRADRMQRFVLRRRQPSDGIAVVDLELVGDAQLLAQPDDAFGLGLAEMVYREHGRGLRRGRSKIAGIAAPGNDIGGVSTRAAPAYSRKSARIIRLLAQDGGNEISR